jgi:Nucleotide modification associated domain 3
MKIILSRKGFDSKSGGKPSPIINDVPFSLPIPVGNYPSKTKYGSLGFTFDISKINKRLTAETYFTKTRCFGAINALLVK